MALSIEQALLKAKELGGVPESVELDQFEARDFILEFAELKNEKITIGTNLDSKAMKVDFLLNGLDGETALENIKKIITGWNSGDYYVTYGETPLTIKIRKTKKNDNN